MGQALDEVNHASGIRSGSATSVLAGGLLGGWLARRSTGRLDVREQLRQLG